MNKFSGVFWCLIVALGMAGCNRGDRSSTESELRSAMATLGSIHGRCAGAHAGSIDNLDMLTKFANDKCQTHLQRAGAASFEDLLQQLESHGKLTIAFGSEVLSKKTDFHTIACLAPTESDGQPSADKVICVDEIGSVSEQVFSDLTLDR